MLIEESVIQAEEAAKFAASSAFALLSETFPSASSLL